MVKRRSVAPDEGYNVVEILAPHPKAGGVRVVRNRKPGFKLPLRNARYRLCNVFFSFADGFACGIVSERRAVLGSLLEFRQTCKHEYQDVNDRNETYCVACDEVLGR